MDLAAVVPNEYLEDVEEIQERGRTAFSAGDPNADGSLEAKVIQELILFHLRRKKKKSYRHDM